MTTEKEKDLLIEELKLKLKEKPKSKKKPKKKPKKKKKVYKKKGKGTSWAKTKAAMTKAQKKSKSISKVGTTTRAITAKDKASSYKFENPRLTSQTTPLSQILTSMMSQMVGGQKANIREASALSLDRSLRDSEVQQRALERATSTDYMGYGSPRAKRPMRNVSKTNKDDNRYYDDDDTDSKESDSDIFITRYDNDDEKKRPPFHRSESSSRYRAPFHSESQIFDPDEEALEKIKESPMMRNIQESVRKSSDIVPFKPSETWNVLREAYGSPMMPREDFFGSERMPSSVQSSVDFPLGEPTMIQRSSNVLNLSDFM